MKKLELNEKQTEAIGRCKNVIYNSSLSLYLSLSLFLSIFLSFFLSLRAQLLDK
jgi:hypothetical protein